MRASCYPTLAARTKTRRGWGTQHLAAGSETLLRRGGRGAGARLATGGAKSARRRVIDDQRLLRLHTLNEFLHGHGCRGLSWSGAGGPGVRGIHGYAGVRRQEVYRILQPGHGCTGRDGRDNLRRHNHNELGICLVLRDRLEKLAQDWNVSQEWDLLKGFCFAVVEQAADGKALAFAQFDLGLDFPDIDGGHLESRYLYGIGEIQRADFGSDLEPDGAAGSDGGNEVEANAVLLELNGDRRPRAGAGGALDHRIRIFSSSQEAGLLAVLGQHVGLREYLHQAFGFKGLDGCAQIQAGEERKEVQFIG